MYSLGTTYLNGYMEIESDVIESLKIKEEFENTADKIFAIMNNKPSGKIIRPMIKHDVEKRIDFERALIQQ